MIEAVGLGKVFEDFVAVENINLTVEPGTVVAVLGPNGAGKTTTVRMLTSILTPTSGWARLEGYDVVTQAPQVRANVGVLTEQHGLYERMRGYEYLDFFARVYHLSASERDERIRKLMQRFGLGFALDKRVGQYSKGMKQKLALVRAMLHDPPVLLLDEPTSAMDPQSAKQVREAIMELRSDQRTVVITTHNLNEAQLLADRIAIIRQGRIIADGTFEQLAEQVVGAPVMRLALANSVNGLADDLRDLVTVHDHGTDWIDFRTTNPTVDNPRVLRFALEHGAEVVTLSLRSRTLEDVYLLIVEEDEQQVGTTR